MKYLIIFLFPVLLFAQSNDNLDYFPHHIGDIWQYVSYPDGDFYELKITKIDTSINYDSLFIFYNQSNKWGYKIELDMNNIFIPPSVNPWYKLDVPIGTIWVREEDVEWVKYWGDDVEYLWGRDFDTKILYNYFWNPPDSSAGYAGSAEILAKGIGILRYEWEGGKTELLGCIIDGKEYGTLVNVINANNDLVPKLFALKNYPNPFNGQTIISYSLPTESYLSIKIYDLLGREIITLFSGHKRGSTYIEIWEPKNISSGIYIAELNTKTQILTTKLQYLK